MNTKRSLPDQKPSAAQPQSTVRDEENQTEQVEEAYFPREMSAQAKEIIMQFKEKQQRELEQMNQTESQYQESSSCRKSGSEQKQVSPKLMRILKQPAGESNPYGLVSRNSPKKSRVVK